MACCFTLSRGETVLLVSVYGTAASVALLSVLGLHGHDFGAGFSTFTTDILHQVCLSVYGICLMTNLLLFLGLLLPLRPLLVPWLTSHVLLCLALTAFSCYYLILYVQTDCQSWSPCTYLKDTKYVTLPLSDPSNFKVDVNCLESGQVACNDLLGYSSSLVAALIILTYLIYLVQDFFDKLRYELKDLNKHRSQVVVEAGVPVPVASEGLPVSPASTNMPVSATISGVPVTSSINSSRTISVAVSDRQIASPASGLLETVTTKSMPLFVSNISGFPVSTLSTQIRDGKVEQQNFSSHPSSIT